jgi:hypothetical protein
MTKPRYLTKSRFKLATECPTKLFYTGKRDIYSDQSLDDPFLRELAKGGFQVGELAKQYFPEGHDIEELDYETALQKTNNLLVQENVTIFEAAILFENLFIRVDILRKTGNVIELFEVKAKSYRGSEGLGPFLNAAGNRLNASGRSYVLDIAFQTYVVRRAFPDSIVKSYLMMADKDVRCSTDGLNQKFRIKKDADGRTRAVASPGITEVDLHPHIITPLAVDALCGLAYDEFGGPDVFEETVREFATRYELDEKIPPQPSKTCGTCQFRTTEEESGRGLRSGFEECWRETFSLRSDQLPDDTILPIWDFRRKDSLIAEGRVLMSGLAAEDIPVQGDAMPGISRSERQWMQIRKQVDRDDSVFVDSEGLRSVMSSWNFPLNFIDFETTAVAVPFNKGHRPYEHLAFQFSHHLVHENGHVEHKSQFLKAVPGEFPNYDFLRALKTALETNNGTIFRYAAHENSYLNHLYKQLMEDPNPPSDRDSLCVFIANVTVATANAPEQWHGPRAMVDMLELVKRFHYDPRTKGSNSIKKVLPATMGRSDFLKEKYSLPIYGSADLPSLNFRDFTWVVERDGKIVDPYQLLPKLFQDVDTEQLDLLSEGDQLADGGAALTAYARLQFEEMSDYERAEIEAALLKYCELDTFAMVMLYEAWRAWCSDTN